MALTKRRIYREDVDYQFFLTENLLEWQAVVSESLPSVKVEPDRTGLETSTRVDWTNASACSWDKAVSAKEDD